MPQGLTIGQVRERVRRARCWQEHSRLVFEVLHSPAEDDLHHLFVAYRESLQQTPTPLLRWAFASLVVEICIYDNHIKSEKYSFVSLFKEGYVTNVFDELRRVVRESPRSVFGYIGLARAYGKLADDPEIRKYERVLGERTIIVEIDGKKIPQKLIETDNSER